MYFYEDKVNVIKFNNISRKYVQWNRNLGVVNY